MASTPEVTERCLVGICSDCPDVKCRIVQKLLDKIAVMEDECPFGGKCPDTEISSDWECPANVINVECRKELKRYYDAIKDDPYDQEYSEELLEDPEFMRAVEDTIKET